MKDKNRLYKLNVFDILLGVGVLVFSIAPLVMAISAPKGTTAQIYRDGKLINELKLSTPGIFDIGDNVEVEVKNGKIHVSKTNCPRKICAHEGWIEAPSQKIICIPKRLIIEIKAGGNTKSYDAVSY